MDGYRRRRRKKHRGKYVWARNRLRVLLGIVHFTTTCGTTLGPLPASSGKWEILTSIGCVSIGPTWWMPALTVRYSSVESLLAVWGVIELSKYKNVKLWLHGYCDQNFTTSSHVWMLTYLEWVNEKPLRYNGGAPRRSGLVLLDLWQPHPIMWRRPTSTSLKIKAGSPPLSPAS